MSAVGCGDFSGTQQSSSGSPAIGYISLGLDSNTWLPPEPFSDDIMKIPQVSSFLCSKTEFRDSEKENVHILNEVFIFNLFLLFVHSFIASRGIQGCTQYSIILLNFILIRTL